VSIKHAKKHSATGLCPDPLRELIILSRPYSWTEGKWQKIGVTEGRKGGRGKKEGAGEEKIGGNLLHYF